MSLSRRTLLLVVNQIASRGFTFGLNLLVVRHVGAEVFGLQAIQLYLLNTTILFLSREGLRRACQRFSHPDASLHLAHLINLAWLAVAVSLICTIVLVQVFLFWPPPLVAQVAPTYSLAVWVYGLSALFEMLSEPLYVVAQNQLLVGLRVKLDSVATVVRCIVTYVCICWGGLSLMGFAYGQLAYALSVTFGYYLCYFRNRSVFHPALQRGSQLFPHIVSGQMWTDPALMQLASTFSFQSLEKLLLTEGEKMVLMGVGAGLEEQGVYGLVSNLGSLVARILFQPLEESAFLEFSRSFRISENSSSVVDTHARSITLLNVLVRFLGLVGSVLVAFGPNYTFVFLDIFYGPRWSIGSAPEALSWYCVYLLIIAVNGVTEAFFFSIVSAKQLVTYNGVLVGFSIGYLAACSALVSYGAKGLILANCVNMLLRISYSVYFIRSRFPTALETKQVFPPFVVLLTLLASFLVTRISLDQLSQHTIAAYLPHIGVGIACMAVFLTTAFVTQRVFIAEFRLVMSAR